jgi:hypothetical protein
MTGIFNRGGAGGPGGGRGGGGRGGGGGGRGGGGGGRGGRGGNAPRAIGDKIFSDLFTLKSDIGNNILRQSPILGNNMPAKPVTWVEKGVLKNFATPDIGASVNMSLAQEGSDLSIDEDFFDLGGNSLLAIRVFAEVQRRFGVTLPLSTLFLIEKGEIIDACPELPLNIAARRGHEPDARVQAHPQVASTAAAPRSCRPCASKTSTTSALGR